MQNKTCLVVNNLLIGYKNPRLTCTNTLWSLECDLIFILTDHYIKAQQYKNILHLVSLLKVDNYRWKHVKCAGGRA